MEAIDLLVPRPRDAVWGGGWWALPRRLVYRIEAPDPERAGWLRSAIERLAGERGIEAVAAGAGEEAALRVHAGGDDGAQGYRLELDGSGAEIRAAGSAGAFYGIATLRQWARLHAADGRLPYLTTEDAPDLDVRGVLLDVSRDRVPTLETLRGLVDLLADLKVNQLQLYMEHTFAYEGHEEVWRDSGAYDADDVRELDAHCRSRFVELVPNQNSFGHFHRWLTHDRYRPLAEVPEGVEHPFSESVEPFSLCPTDPRSLSLLADLYDQLLPLFASDQVNVGLDETFDLGLGRSREEVEERGKERVYLDFLRAVHRLVRERGHRMQFWGDIIVQRPELIPELPPSAIGLLWGYEAGHPFAEQARAFAASGLDFLVCPGTSSWNSLAGRSRNALLNQAEAARAGTTTGARGLLNTDWGDNGHLQPLPVSYLGFLAGAAFGWRVASAELPTSFPVEDLLDAHVFRDAGGVTGAVARRLGDTYQCTGTRSYNGTPLFFLVAAAHQDLTHPRYEGMTVESLERAAAWVEGELARLPAAEMQRPDGALVQAELRWVAGLLLVACNVGIARLRAGRATPIPGMDPGVRRRLAADLEPLVAEHEVLWVARNRPPGRGDSVGRLERTLRLLRSDG